MNKSILAITSILISVFIAAGCSDLNHPFSGLAGDSSSVTGTLTRIDTLQTGTNSIRILVEENTGVNEPSEDEGKKVWFTISSKTDIYRMGRRGPASADAHSFKTGQVVKAWDTGTMMTSYPSQTGARRVLILSNK